MANMKKDNIDDVVSSKINYIKVNKDTDVLNGTFDGRTLIEDLDTGLLYAVKGEPFIGETMIGSVKYLLKEGKLQQVTVK